MKTVEKVFFNAALQYHLTGSQNRGAIKLQTAYDKLSAKYPADAMSRAFELAGQAAVHIQRYGLMAA